MSLKVIEGIEVDIIRKRIKNLNLRVIPPEGKVVVSVPLAMSEKATVEFVSGKRSWIIKQQTRLKEKDFELPKEFVSGEEHYLFGNKFTLILRDDSTKEGVCLKDSTITLYCKAGTEREFREKIIERWYRENLLKNIPHLIKNWEEIMNVKVGEFRVRKMHTRWGTCNPRASRIWISLMLAKRRPELLEYIVVHEMVHLLERGHNKRFYNYMDSFLPGWKKLRAELK
jgi:predicted metal-dependent hydrolase